jgi:hypothetical protein
MLLYEEERTSKSLKLISTENKFLAYLAMISKGDVPAGHMHSTALSYI